jgi:hypothetical protein
VAYTVVDYTIAGTTAFDDEAEARAFMRSTRHALRLWSVDDAGDVRLVEEACEGELRSEVPEHPQAERDWFDRRMDAALERLEKKATQPRG